MSNGSDIASEIEAALIEAGEATGDGEFTGTLIQKSANTGTGYSPVYSDPTETTVAIVVSSYSKFLIDDKTIKANDREILITAAAGVTPAAKDHLKIGDDTYMLITVDPVSPGGTDLLYVAQARNLNGQ